MIAACPKCSTRYRVENERLTADGVRLRCTRCQAVFRVRAPGAVAPLAEPQVEAQPTPMPQPPDRSRLVLVADSDADGGKVTAGALAGWGLHPLKGNLAGCWAVEVSGNWRLIFRFEGTDAVAVDYDDYH